MIHVKNSTQYYINERALTFSENDLDDPNRVAVSLVSGTVILVHVPGTIDFASDGNYERWTLRGYSTRLVEPAAHYIYARLSRTDRTALIVFSIKNYNIDGSITTVNEADGTSTTTEPNPDYFYIKIGELTATDSATNPTVDRELTYDSGLLSTAKGDSMSDPSDMWELLPGVTPLIRAKHWLTSFTVKGFLTLIGGLKFSKGQDGDEKPVTDIRRAIDPDNEYLLNADGTPQTDAEGNPMKNPDFVPVSDETLPTTAYLQEKLDGIDDRYISKMHPDETEYRVKFKDGIEMGEFVTGMIGGSGAQIDRDGHGEMQSLTLHEFLEVPELRFNRVDVVSGELWNSIAFGLVESVDTSRRICTLKLEEGERSGLKPNDICRGIFSDFGAGTVTEEGEDHNGFQKMYGFSTAYFTPTEILVNEEGRFQFRYNLQEGTTVHPCPSMKFAVYGNFIDSSRQASAYSTRTYKRYLNKVNTWKIDPDKHIYAQFGDIDGLTIGGYTMKGYGSFQNNVYLTGAVFQFTPQQKEELKGEDAYSAQLSDYEGIIIIDDEGNVIGGEQMVMNVITSEGNVMTNQRTSYTTEDGKYIKAGEYNVTTSVFKLSTQVVASRGSTQLHHALSVEEDGYVIGLNAVGCEAVVMNGVVVVTSVSNPKNCKINITVNCEGKWVTNLVYHITAVTDGRNPVIADMDNEMEAVACDPDGAVLFGLPVQTNVSMWAGTKQLRITRAEITAPEGVTAHYSLIDQNEKPLEELTEEETAAIEHVRCRITIPDKTTVDEVEVPGITKEAARTLPIAVTVYATYGSDVYHRTLTFTVNKVIAGENAHIYQLKPSVSSIVKNKADELSVSEISCGAKGYNGKDYIQVDTLPSHLRMELSVDGGESQGYEMGTPVPVTKDNKEFAFALYQTSGGEETQIDYETVPLIRDGIEFKNVSAYIRSNTEPATPEGGSFANPKPDTEGWSLEIPTDTDYIVWVSFRTFVSNDVYAEGEGWSKPVQMTDTSTLKVIWSSKEEPAPLPDAPEMNEDWTDDPEANAVWRAEASKVNGVWGKWMVSKIQGKDALRLVASTSTISRNSFGHYQPEVVRVRVIRGGKEESMYIYAWGLDSKGIATGVSLQEENASNYIYASSVDIRPGSLESKDFDALVFRVYEDPTATEYIKDDEKALDEISVVFVGDGSSGPMPRNRGEYDPKETYFYNDMYRDFVWFTTSGGVEVFLRDGYGSAFEKNGTHVDSDTGLPMEGGISQFSPNPDASNNDYWIKVPRTIMTAIDTALVENANIAGFMFQGGRMVAQNMPENTNPIPESKLILDGTTGYFHCEDADVNGNIDVETLTYGFQQISSTTTFTEINKAMVFAEKNSRCVLPGIELGRSRTIQLFCVSGDVVISGNPDNPHNNGKSDYIWAMGEMATGYQLKSGTMYTLTSLPETFSSLGGHTLNGSMVWVLTAPFSSGAGPDISMLIDDTLNEESMNPVQNKVIVNELKKYAILAGDNSFTGDNDFSGDNDFTGTLSVNGAPIVYNTRYGYWKLDGDLLVTGGVTAYGNDSAFTPSTVMDALKLDPNTLKLNSSGALTVIGGVGSGGAESFWDLTDTPTSLFGYGIEDAYIRSGVIYLGSNSIEPLTEALGDSRYLMLTGGTLKDGNTVSPLTLDCTARAPYITFKNNGTNHGFIGGATEGKTMHIQAGAGSDSEYSVFRVRVDGSLQVSKNATYYDVLTGLNYTSYLPLLNSGSTHATKSSVIYSPTGAGTSGQVLQSNGSGAPGWVNQNTLSAGSATNDGDGSAIADTYYKNRGYVSSSNIKTTINGAYSASGYSPSGASYTYGAVLSFKSTAASVQIHFTDGSNSSGNQVFFRSQYQTGGVSSIGTTWYEFITSKNIGSQSVSSANKLTASRTIWGQSFNGSSDVSGNMSNVGNITFNANNTASIGEWGNSARLLHANIVSAGGDSHSLWLVGSSDSSNYGIVFARNTTGDATNEVARINSTAFLPYTSGGLDLGTSSKPWGDIYTSGAITLPAVGNAYTEAALLFKSSSTTYGRIGGNNSGNLGIYARNSVIIRGGATSSSAPTTGVTIDASGNLLSTGGITAYSDIRKKTKLEDVELTLDEVANAPLIKHYYNSDEKKTTHVGSVAQYWAETVGNDWFCKKDDDGFYTMEIQNAALASAISVAREFRRYKKETSELIATMREEIENLKKEVELLKRK